MLKDNLPCVFQFVRFFTFTWRLGVVMCKGVHYLQNVSIICSVLNLIGLSLERSDTGALLVVVVAGGGGGGGVCVCVCVCVCWCVLVCVGVLV